MFEFCFCARLFSVKNQNNTSVLFHLFEENKGLNKETGIRSIHIMFCSDSVWVTKIEKLVVTDLTKYLVKLM